MNFNIFLDVCILGQYILVVCLNTSVMKQMHKMIIDYMSNEYVLIYFKYVNNYFKFQEG